MEKLQAQINELKTTVAEQQRYINYQLQDVQLEERGQLAFPLTQNTIDLLSQTFYKNVYPSLAEYIDFISLATTRAFTIQHFYTSGVVMSGGTVTIDLPFGADPDDQTDITTTGTWAYGDCQIILSPEASTVVNFDQIDIDGAGAVSPTSTTFYLPNMRVTGVTTPSGSADQYIINCNDPNWVGIITYQIVRNYSAGFKS
jgi:hypothetical protein